MFLRDQWYVAAGAEEVGRDPFPRIMLGEPVVLYRREDGTPVALEDRCCHRRAPLHRGRLVGDALQCGYHGFTFDTDGKCVWVPGQSRVPPDARVASYPVVEKHKWLWLWMGEPARADAALIPDFHWQDDPAWAATGTHLPIACHYQLIVDNLLDLSHVAFIHADTIGTEDSDAKLAVEHGDDFVRLTRHATDVPMPPIYTKLGFEGRMDQTKVMSFAPPAFVWIDISSVERKADGHNAKSAHLNILNAITPETETTSHYFWASARDFDTDNAAFTDFMFRETAKAFDQDRDILEAQQGCIDLDPACRTVDVSGDAGGLHARCIVGRLMEEQNRTIETIA